jgi:uncharacterized membrane protein
VGPTWFTHIPAIPTIIYTCLYIWSLVAIVMYAASPELSRVEQIKHKNSGGTALLVLV